MRAYVNDLNISKSSQYLSKLPAFLFINGVNLYHFKNIFRYILALKINCLSHFRKLLEFYLNILNMLNHLRSSDRL